VAGEGVDKGVTGVSRDAQDSFPNSRNRRRAGFRDCFGMIQQRYLPGYVEHTPTDRSALILSAEDAGKPRDLVTIFFVIAKTESPQPTNDYSTWARSHKRTAPACRYE
jgi:hypothetical protein